MKKIPFRKTTRRAGLMGWLVAGLLLFGGMASLRSAERKDTLPTPIFWPPPPAEPRIAYVKTISQPSDFGVKSSWWGRFWNTVTGQKPEGLLKPLGIALDDRGDLFLTDPGGNSVHLFGRAEGRYRRLEKIGAFRLASPVSIVAKGRFLFLADSELRKVLAFDHEGKFLFEVNREFQRPVGLAMDGEKLFVADALENRILVFDLQGRFLSQFGERGTAPGQLNFPTHLATDSKGRLYVTDSMNFRIQVFDLEGRFQKVIGSAGDSSGHFSRPKGVAVDRMGHIYVVDALFDNVQIFDQEGRFLMDFGAAGSEAGEFWLPSGIAVGSDDQIYVADSYNHRVQIFKYVGKP